MPKRSPCPIGFAVSQHPLTISAGRSRPAPPTWGPSGHEIGNVFGCDRAATQVSRGAPVVEQSSRISSCSASGASAGVPRVPAGPGCRRSSALSRRDVLLAATSSGQSAREPGWSGGITQLAGGRRQAGNPRAGASSPPQRSTPRASRCARTKSRSRHSGGLRLAKGGDELGNPLSYDVSGRAPALLRCRRWPGDGVGVGHAHAGIKPASRGAAPRAP